MPKLWVIAPVFNEEKSLNSFVREWIPLIRAVTGGDFTFCILNDSSRDGSFAVLKSLAKEYSEILVIDKANTGHDATCLLGYKKALDAKADWILQIDSDGQCDPGRFEELWMARTDGLVHYGHRQGREDGCCRYLISKMLAVILFFLSFRWIRDSNVPYRLMHRDALKTTLERIPAEFRLAQVLLARIHDETPGIQWHTIHFRKGHCRGNPVNIPFFIREAIFFIRDYILWAWRDGNPNLKKRMLRIGRVFLSLLAAYYLIVFVILAFMRMQTLVEYDWNEGLHLLQVHRLLAGMSLYPAPSYEYIPLIYGPLYNYISGFVSFFAGESYASLRFVSFVSTLGALVMIGMLVRSMTGSKQAAWVAAGLYVGMYGVVDFWFDIARVDSLFIFFIMTTAYFIRIAPKKGGMAMVWAAMAATCAVLTKQTALVPVFALCVWCFTVKNGSARRTAILCLGAISLSQIIPMIATDGWFFYYVYKVPSAHPILMKSVLLFLKDELFRYLITGFVLSLFAFYILFSKHKGKQDALFFLFFFLAMVFAGIASRFKIGGHVNNLMPLAAVLAVGCGLLLGHLSSLKVRDALAVIFLLLFFNLQVFYWPPKALPTLKALERYRIQLNFYRSLDGPIFAPGHAYLPILAGKNESAFWATMSDMLLTSGKESQLLRKDLRRALQERRFKAVVLRDRYFDNFPYGLLTKTYKRIRISEFLSDEEAWKSGLILYLPRIDGF